MFKVDSDIITAHDLNLVVLAVVICALASFAAINLLRHAGSSTGRMRKIWLCIAAISTGSGIWATHFIAMLAFSPGIPSGYNIILTFGSLIAAILLTGAGLTISSLPDRRTAPWLGGALVGAGIAAMYQLGMAAFEVQGTILVESLPDRTISSSRDGTSAPAAPRGRIARQITQVEVLRRRTAHTGDHQPSFHRPERRIDRSRCDRGHFSTGHSDHLALQSAWR